ncbi:MAG: hypothetical protein M4579_000002 [Chaenotheca gracillima]|nr:MAG: hypothetical protein M4579_000002 [Chaenotheca gracillima]
MPPMIFSSSPPMAPTPPKEPFKEPDFPLFEAKTGKEVPPPRERLNGSSKQASTIPRRKHRAKSTPKATPKISTIPTVNGQVRRAPRSAPQPTKRKRNPSPARELKETLQARRQATSASNAAAATLSTSAQLREKSSLPYSRPRAGLIEISDDEDQDDYINNYGPSFLSPVIPNRFTGNINATSRPSDLIKSESSSRDDRVDGATGTSILGQFLKSQKQRRDAEKPKSQEKNEIPKKVKFGSVEFLQDRSKPLGQNMMREDSRGSLRGFRSLQETGAWGRGTTKDPPRGSHVPGPVDRKAVRPAEPRPFVSKTAVCANPILYEEFEDETKTLLPPLSAGHLGALVPTSAQQMLEESESDEDEDEDESNIQPEQNIFQAGDSDIEFEDTIRVKPVNGATHKPPAGTPESLNPAFLSAKSPGKDRENGVVSTSPILQALFPPPGVASRLASPTLTPEQPELEFWEYTVYRNNWRNSLQNPEQAKEGRVSCGSYHNLHDANEAALAEALVLRTVSGATSIGGTRGLHMTEGLELHVDVHDHGMLNVVLIHASMDQLHIHVERCLRASRVDSRTILQRQIHEGRRPGEVGAWKPEKAYLVWERIELDDESTFNWDRGGATTFTATTSSPITSPFIPSSVASDQHHEQIDKKSVLEQDSSGGDDPKSLISGPHTTLSSANEAAFKCLSAHIHKHHQRQHSEIKTQGKKPKSVVESVKRAELAQRLRQHWQECERRDETFKAEVEMWISPSSSSKSNPGLYIQGLDDDDLFEDKEEQQDGEKEGKCCAIRVWVEERKVLGPRN